MFYADGNALKDTQCLVSNIECKLNFCLITRKLHQRLLTVKSELTKL